MVKAVVGWFGITGKDRPAFQRFSSEPSGWSISDAGRSSGPTCAFFADPEGHVVGLSKGALR